MHLQAGVANGSMVELHYLAVELSKQIYTGLPDCRDGWLTLPDAPGLGFELNRDARAGDCEASALARLGQGVMPFLGARNPVRWKPVRGPYWAPMIGVVAGNIGPHIGA